MVNDFEKWEAARPAQPAVQSPARPPKSWLKLLRPYLLAWLIVFLTVKFVIPSYEVRGSSMEPTYQAAGDRVVADQVFFRLTGGPKRGDIVILARPGASSGEDDLIKRVVGLPGERLEIRQGTLYINGQAISEPYIQNRATYDYPTTLLPANCYFVLGDNRPVSYDSHYFGCVPADHLVAHVLATYPWHF